MDNALAISIRNRQGVMFRGKAKAVSSFNDKGIFDILAGHENFISLIRQKIIILKNDKEKQDFKIVIGVMRVYRNKVNIYVGI